VPSSCAAPANSRHASVVKSLFTPDARSHFAFCVDCDTAVEFDGAPHFQELKVEYEAERTAFLERLGLSGVHPVVVDLCYK
jgi:hypothetical protein